MRRSTLIIGAGGLFLLAGAALTAEPWLDAQRWQSSPEATQAARNASAPLLIRPQSTPGQSGSAPAHPGPIPNAAGRAPRAPGSAPNASKNDDGRMSPPVGEMPSIAADDTSRASRSSTDTASAPPTRSETVTDARSVPETAAARAGGLPGAATADARAGPAARTAPDASADTDAALNGTPESSPYALTEAAFQFVDPPAPGANARLTLSIHNPTAAPSDTLALDLPLAWLDGYTIRGVQPLPVDESVDGHSHGATRRLLLPGPGPNQDTLVEVDLATTAEVIDAPDLVVLDSAGREVGHAHPPTQAPPADPGPVYAVDIPRLRLHAGVVPVDWEPPLFVVGQVRTSAYVTQGNSVLVGHVRGAAGYNVFDHLDQVRPGDPIVAMSRGETYDFVVTETRVLPEDDVSPLQPTDAPRLTLMTCAGDWNPLTRDYSSRLWVVASPIDAAQTARLPDPTPTPKPLLPVDQVAAHGGLGNTDADLTAAYGVPTGEAPPGVAAFPRQRDGLTHRASYVETSDGTRRATLVAEHLATHAIRTLEAARTRARALLPRDAIERPATDADATDRALIVERFSSALLGRALPAEAFGTAGGGPGDLVVVYTRAADGQITDIAVSVGDDPAPLLNAIGGR